MEDPISKTLELDRVGLIPLSYEMWTLSEPQFQGYKGERQ